MPDRDGPRPTSSSSPSAAPPACARPTTRSPAALRRAGASVAVARVARAREVRTFALTDLAWALPARRAAAQALAVFVAARGPLLLQHRGAAVAAAGRDPVRRAGGREPARAPRGLAATGRARGGSRRRRCSCRGARRRWPRRRRRAPRRSSCRCRWRPRARRTGRATSPRSPTARTRTRRAWTACWPRGGARGGRARRSSWRASHGAGEDGVRYTGMIPPAEYRALLRRARAFVTDPRREDHGIAQLEALADGCLLVTGAAPGPYAALPLARALDRAPGRRRPRGSDPHGARRPAPGLRRARPRPPRPVHPAGGRRPRRRPPPPGAAGRGASLTRCAGVPTER